MDYYRILEIKEDADFSDIKKKYRKLAIKYHPDKNPGDDEAVKKFRERLMKFLEMRKRGRSMTTRENLKMDRKIIKIKI